MLLVDSRYLCKKMLRGYQQEAISDVYKFFRSGIRSVMLYAPTGAGKTVIASQIIADALSFAMPCCSLGTSSFTQPNCGIPLNCESMSTAAFN